MPYYFSPGVYILYVMSFLNIEGLKIYGIETPAEDAILDFVDPALEQSNSDGAERLATRLRETGIYRFGLMWAEWNGFLKDGRNVWLQSSDRELIVHIYPPKETISRNIHARWNRINHAIDLYEERDPRLNTPVLSFEKFQPENCIPQTLSPWHVSHNFSAVLGLLEQVTQQPTEVRVSVLSVP